MLPLVKGVYSSGLISFSIILRLCRYLGPRSPSSAETLEGMSDAPESKNLEKINQTIRILH